jgi:hypothetical protein
MFPERLKYAVVRPIYKKGDKSLISNYSKNSSGFETVKHVNVNINVYLKIP